MPKRMLIDAFHPEETRVVVVDGTKVEELDFESASKKQLRGNLYLARVTRVEPSLQAAFVEYGGNRHGFLAFSEIHPDYYQIPYEDRIALLEAEEAETLEEQAEEEEEAEKPKSKKSSKKKSKSKKTSEDEEDIDEETADDEDELSDSDDNEDIDDDSDEEKTEGDSDSETDADAEVADEQEKTAKKRRSRSYRQRYKIQEVIKRGQILLIQVVKEERGNKGAAMTTYLSLAGRYCVLMPNTPKGGGISRKIANGSDRKRLKSVVSEFKVPQGMGVIVRTAGAKRTKSEIKRDYDYLSRLWETIRETTLKSIAPALIHEEGNLVKRSIRDLYNKDIHEILVQGDDAYKSAKDFIKMLMPSHAKNVKAYKDPIPLFLRYQVESQIEDSLESLVQLKSGGYLVIHPTEALVSVDVNSGRSTKERNVERTALKTNLEAADEVARQMRLRDLAGLVVIDFIDMDENRNNRAVEKRMKEALSRDRARVQASRISQFGLMEISRQRRRRSLLEGSTVHCPHCQGVGRKRTVDSAALKALRALEEKAARGQTAKARLTVAPEVAAFILNHKRDELNAIKNDFGMYAVVESDPDLFLPEYALTEIEKAPGKNVDAIAEIEKEIRKTAKEAEKSNSRNRKSKSKTDESQDEDAEEVDEERDETEGKKRRRRGRRGGRRRRGDKSKDQIEGAENTDENDNAETAETGEDADNQAEDAPKQKRSRRRKSSKSAKDESGTDDNTETLKTESEDIKAEKPRSKTRRKAPARKSEENEKAPTQRSRSRKKSSESKTDSNSPTEKTADNVKAISEEKAQAKSTTRRKAPTRKTNSEDEDGSEAKTETKAKAKSATKKAAPKKTAAKKPATKKATVKKSTTKKPAPKKVVAKDEAGNTQKAEAKKAPTKKAAPKTKPKPIEDEKGDSKADKKSDTPKKSGWWSLRRKKD